ncbi:MAG TPA: response regulator [Thermoanaerobaculia bacterium]|nr:response regulator [Thermoanaerobaculia bacterium]
MRVLIIDDEPDVRRIATLSLGRVGGMNVIEANGGVEGIRMAEEHAPDVILLDMMMPEMDGASTFRALHENPKTTAIPVIFLTAKAMRGEVRKLEALGAKGVVLKPFNPMTLASDVKAVLQQ